MSLSLSSLSRKISVCDLILVIYIPLLRTCPAHCMRGHSSRQNVRLVGDTGGEQGGRAPKVCSATTWSRGFFDSPILVRIGALESARHALIVERGNVLALRRLLCPWAVLVSMDRCSMARCSCLWRPRYGNCWMRTRLAPHQPRLVTVPHISHQFGFYWPGALVCMQTLILLRINHLES
jgi:hypothetical protein